MKNTVLFIIVTVLIGNVFCLADEKKRMKIFMFVSSFPQINNVSAMNQITGLIDRGHEVTIYSFAKGDFINVQKDFIEYNLINNMVFKLPSSFDKYDIV